MLIRTITSSDAPRTCCFRTTYFLDPADHVRRYPLDRKPFRKLAHRVLYTQMLPRIPGFDEQRFFHAYPNWEVHFVIERNDISLQ